MRKRGRQSLLGHPRVAKSIMMAWVVTTGIGVAQPTIPAEPAGERLSLEDAATLVELLDASQCAVDPTGRRVAFVTRARGRQFGEVPADDPWIRKYLGRSRLHVLDLTTGAENMIGDGEIPGSQPCWSPDGTRLAFVGLSEGALRLGVIADDPNDVRWVGDPLYAAFAHHVKWSPDGSTVLAMVRRPSPFDGYRLPKLEYEAADVIVERSRMEEYLRYWSRATTRPKCVLASIQVDTGTTKDISEVDPFAPRPFCVSPSGAFVLTAESTGYHVHPISGQVDPLARLSHRPRAETPPIWHPFVDLLARFDNHKIGWAMPGEDEVWSEEHSQDQTELRVVSAGFMRAGDGLVVAVDSEPLLAAFQPSFSPSRATHIRIIPVDGSPTIEVPLAHHSTGLRIERLLCASDGVLWQPDPEVLSFVGYDTETQERLLVRYHLGDERLVVMSRGRFLLDPVGAPADHAFLLARVEAPNVPPDLFRIVDTLEDASRLTTVEPRREGRQVDVDLVAASVPHPTTGAELTLHATVVRPQRSTDETALPPAVVHVYGGGDVSSFGHRFAGGDVATLPTQLLIDRGFAVVHLDTVLGPRGQPGQPLQELDRCVRTVLDRVDAAGLVDSRRLAVIGHSYGAYCVAGLLATSDRFRCGVALSGLYDFDAIYGRPRWDGRTSRAVLKDQGRMGGTDPWSDRERYHANSPYQLADQTDEPVLLLHGGDDQITFVEESQKLYGALEALHRDVELAVYPDEDHDPNAWSVAHFVDACGRTLDFLARQAAGGLLGRISLNGEPARGMHLHVWWKQDPVPIAVIGDDGDFDFGAVPCGELLLCLAPGQTWTVKNTLRSFGPIRVEDGVPLWIEIDLPAHRVRGRVIGADGVPRGDMEIELDWASKEQPALSDTSRVSCSVRTVVDSEGGFDFGLVPDGEYTVTAARYVRTWPLVVDGTLEEPLILSLAR